MLRAWSYSSLEAWRTCPRRYHAVKVAKTVAEEENEAQRWGSRVHEAIAAHLTDGAPLGEEFSVFERHVAVVRRRITERHTVLVEHKVALTRAFEPCEFFAPEAWVRAVFDVAILDQEEGSALLFDWKTGNHKKVDSDQLELAALLAFECFPQITHAVTSFVWLKENNPKLAFTRRGIHKRDAPAMWRKFLAQIERLERAHEENAFPPKPSGLCRAHCPVLECQHNGRRK